MCVGGGGGGGGQCFSTLCLSVPPRGDPWAVAPVCNLLAETDGGLVCVCWSTGRRVMAPLSSCQVRKPAEDLQSSQGTNRARRRKRAESRRKGVCVCVCASVVQTPRERG